MSNTNDQNSSAKWSKGTVAIAGDSVIFGAGIYLQETNTK